MLYYTSFLKSESDKNFLNIAPKNEHFGTKKVCPFMIL